MSNISEKTKEEKFEKFYEWLRKDGLFPRKSERLHRKRIFANLLHNQPMTMENFHDFLEFEAIEEEKARLNEEFEGKEVPTANGVLTITEVQRIPEVEGKGYRVFFGQNWADFRTVELLREVVL